MSTRANILIKQKNRNDIVLYCHHDGYINSGLGDALIEFIWNLAIDTEWQTAKTISDKLTCGKFPDSDGLTIKETKAIHGDIEFLYIIEIQDVGLPTLTCYAKLTDEAWQSGSNGIYTTWTKYQLVKSYSDYAQES